MDLNFDQNHHQTSALDMHMKFFDDLGFNNERVYNWRKSILETLENNGYGMSHFSFSRYYSNKTNNKELLQHIVFTGGDAYNLLNSKGLINRGFCPITGETINNTNNYNVYNRVVYLSKKGLEICKNIDREEWNKNHTSIDYDTLQNQKKQTKHKLNIIKIIVIALSAGISIVTSWFIVSPSGFFSFIGFLLLAFILFLVFNRFLIRFFLGLYIRYLTKEVEQGAKR
jgi:hypothetical protein